MHGDRRLHCCFAAPTCMAGERFLTHERVTEQTYHRSIHCKDFPKELADSATAYDECSCSMSRLHTAVGWAVYVLLTCSLRVSQI